MGYNGFLNQVMLLYLCYVADGVAVGYVILMEKNKAKITCIIGRNGHQIN